MNDGPKTLPLDDLHRAAGARFGAFAGWNMPLTYPAGVMKEHLHTRARAGLFDISHMRLIDVAGPDASALLDTACPLRSDELAIGQSKYTFLLNGDAGILDDLIVTRLGDDRFLVVANAGNADNDIARLKSFAERRNCAVRPLDRVFLALQGPAANQVMKDLGYEVDDLAFMSGKLIGGGTFLSRSGYTGEDGFEIGLPEAEARPLVGKLLADDRVLWIGLAARDSLRLEAGLCLHGQDIDPSIDPATAGLMWAIPKSLRAEGRFTGADALRGILERGPTERRVGLAPQGRQPVRVGVRLFDANDNEIGRVTSGGFGPSIERPVAMGYVAKTAAGPLFADVRGTRIPVEISPLPFTSHRYRKG